MVRQEAAQQIPIPSTQRHLSSKSTGTITSNYLFDCPSLTFSFKSNYILGSSSDLSLKYVPDFSPFPGILGRIMTSILCCRSFLESGQLNCYPLQSHEHLGLDATRAIKLSIRIVQLAATYRWHHQLTSRTQTLVCLTMQSPHTCGDSSQTFLLHMPRLQYASSTQGCPSTLSYLLGPCVGLETRGSSACGIKLPAPYALSFDIDRMLSCYETA